MQFIPAGADHSTQMKPSVEQPNRFSFRALVGFVFADQMFDLLRQQAADGCRSPRREDLRLLKGLPAEAYCDVLLLDAL